jgi:hypothetical protein
MFGICCQELQNVCWHGFSTDGTNLKKFAKYNEIIVEKRLIENWELDALKCARMSV